VLVPNAWTIVLCDFETILHLMTEVSTSSAEPTTADLFLRSHPTIPHQALEMPHWLLGAQQPEDVLVRAASRGGHVLRSTGLNCLIHILDLDRRRPPTSQPNWRAVETTFGDLNGVQLSTVRGLGWIYHPLAGAVVHATAPNVLSVEFPDNSFVQYTLTNTGWTEGSAFTIDDRFFPSLHDNWGRAVREDHWTDLYDEDNRFGILD
jgi:hypothetical protein